MEESRSASSSPSPIGPELAHLLGLVCDHLFEGVQILDFDFRYLYLNGTAAEQGRLPRADYLGRTMTDLYPGVDRTEMFAVLQRSMSERVPLHMVNRFTYPDGHTGWFDLRVNPVPMGVLVLSIDVSSEKAVEEELQRSRDDLATTLHCMADGVIATDLAGRIVRMNPSAQDLTGWSEEDAKGRPLNDVLRVVSLRTGSTIPDPVELVLRGERKVGLGSDLTLERPDGTRVPVAVSGSAIRDRNDSIFGVVLALTSMKEEYELASMLQQSQKMEAIGRLAGGVAHDFNNILTVIGGYAGILLDASPGDPGFRDAVVEIKTAGERATSLTRQLLAFSRRQVLRPEVLDLNGVAERMEDMLRRLIGEDVDLVTRLSPGLDPVLVDPGQVEQILMNLAVNARDAMPTGGKLTLETANVHLDREYARKHPSVHPGPHAMIAVTDTGVGMDGSTTARIFEPFFTTKEIGRGTGLGLATVYGIVKQSGGSIWVYSEPGLGTTFKVYLPRAEGTVSSVGAVEEMDAPQGTETILLVEDEPGVRRLIRGVLETAGYTVLESGAPPDAIALSQTYAGRIDLLLTDVVMPTMGGRAMADQILTVRPGLRVVYMSGYTDDAIVHHGVLAPGTAFIEKPISAETLLTKIRAFLS